MIFLQGLQSMETSAVGLTQISRENVNILSMKQQFKNVLSYHQWKEGFFFKVWSFLYSLVCTGACVHACVHVCGGQRSTLDVIYQLFYIFKNNFCMYMYAVCACVCMLTCVCESQT